MYNSYQSNYQFEGNNMQMGRPSLQEKDSPLKKTLIIIGFVQVVLIMLIPFFSGLLLSFKEYGIFMGILGSPFVGLDNFKVFFNSLDFGALASNTAVISIISLMFGAGYVFIASLSITNIRNVFLKSVALILFMIPAFISPVFFTDMIPFSLLVHPEPINYLVGIFDGLRLAGFILVVAFFSKERGFKESAKMMLLFVAVKLLMFFTVDTSVVLSTYNPANYESLDVFDTFIYRKGILTADYSYSSAVSMVKILMQLIPATLGGALIALTMRKPKPQIAHFGTASNENKFSGKVFFVFFAIIPVIFYLIITITSGNFMPYALGSPKLISGWIRGLYLAFFSAFFVSALAFGIALLSRKTGVIGLICLCFVTTVSSCTIASFLLCKDIGVLDTYAGVFLANTYMLPLVSLLMTCAFRNNDNILKDIGVFVVFFAVLFGWFWNDFIWPSIILTSSELYPLSIIMRDILMAVGSMPDFKPDVVASMVITRLPLYVGLAGCIVGGILKKIKR